MNFKDLELIKEALKNNETVEFPEKTLILASASESRFKIMKKSGLNFIVIPSLADEEALKVNFGKVDTEKRAVEYVKMLAYEKATWINARVKNAVVLAADTIAFYENEILEKPKDEFDARRIFSALSNSIHVAITGVCIMDGEKIDNFAKVSPVKMKEISKELQDILVKEESTYRYAGGYCIDGNIRDRAIVDKTEFDNVMGLPIDDIIIKLKEEGYDFSE